MKPKYTRNLTRMQFFKSADYYGMSKIYEDLYLKSSKNINVKNLIPIIKDKRNMLIAIRCIKSNIGAEVCGIDGITFTELLQRYSTEELHKLVCNLIDNYETIGIRKVFIHKNNSKLKTVGIYNAIDKLVQQMIKQVLEPYCEGKFYKHSYGFRPTRQIGEVIARCHHLVVNTRCEYCVDIDIKDFFDNVHHNRLIKQIWNIGVKDKKVLMLIKKIIKAPVNGIIQTKGLQQGSILSPFLSNIVLNEIDQWVAGQWEEFQKHCKSNKAPEEFVKELQYKKKILNPNYNPKKKVKGNIKYFRKWKSLKTGYLIRYADDFKIFTPNYKEAIKWFNGVKQFIEKRLKLEINKEKSKIVNLKKSKSNFLGFELKIINTKKKQKKRRTNVKNKSSKTKYILQVRVSKEKIREMSKEFKKSLKLIVKNPNDSVMIINRLNLKILKWQNYCKLSTYPSKDLNEVYLRNYTKINVLKKYYGILKCISMDEAKKTSKLIKEHYSEYNGVTFKSSFGGIIFPIWAIKQQKLSQRNPKVSPYIREDLIKYWYKTLTWDNSEGKQLIERYCNNKWINSLVAVHAIGLYTAQYGKCPLTDLPLSDGFEIHHKVTKASGGSDRYINLVMLNEYSHKLVHSSNKEIIQKYIKLIKNLGGKINKAYLNKLRKMLNLEPIMIMP